MTAAPPAQRLLGGVRPFLVDVVAPICAYFALKAVGASDFLALAVGAGIAVVDGMVSLAIERRLRWLPIYVTAMFALTGGLAWLTHDPRVMLMKASIGSAAIGLYLIGLSIFHGALGRILTPLIARGSDERASRFADAWRTDASLRRKLGLSCLLAGLALIAESAGRAAVVLSFTVGQSLILAHGPAVALVIVLFLILRFMVTPAVARAMAPAALGRSHGR